MRTVLGLLLLPTLALAAETPGDFAFGVSIESDGKQALYEIVVPASVYQGVARRDLGDMRVFNADGEPVPFAIEPRPVQQTEKSQPVAVPYFPLHGEQATDLESLQLRVEKGGRGTVVNVKTDGGDKPATKRRLLAYLLDMSALERPYEALELDWRQDTSSFAANLRVESSDDLKSWSTLVSQAPLVRVDYGGQRLEQRTIEFQPRHAKYLRLSWPAAGEPGSKTDQPIQLTRVLARTGEIFLEPDRAWRDVQASPGEKPGEYQFDVGGPFPVERIHLGLPQNNTVARIDLSSRSDPRQPWHLVTSTVVYRLTQNGQQVASPDVAVAGNADRYWLLRVDQKGGGLGSGTPKLSIAWVPQKLVFAARGNGPFQIAYGSSTIQPAAYPIDTVVPGWRTDKQPDLTPAQVLPERLLAGPAALKGQRDYKVWYLWTALVAAVLLLAWMAWRLTRQMQPAEKTVAPITQQGGPTAD